MTHEADISHIYFPQTLSTLFVSKSPVTHEASMHSHKVQHTRNSILCLCGLTYCGNWAPHRGRWHSCSKVTLGVYLTCSLTIFSSLSRVDGGAYRDIQIPTIGDLWWWLMKLTSPQPLPRDPPSVSSPWCGCSVCVDPVLHTKGVQHNSGGAHWGKKVNYVYTSCIADVIIRTM